MSADGNTYLQIERDGDVLKVRRCKGARNKLKPYWRMWAYHQVCQLGTELGSTLQVRLSLRSISIESNRLVQGRFWKFVDKLSEIVPLQDQPITWLAQHEYASNRAVWLIHDPNETLIDEIRCTSLPLWAVLNFHLELQHNKLHLVRKSKGRYSGVMRQRDVRQYVEWRIAFNYMRSRRSLVA